MAITATVTATLYKGNTSSFTNVLSSAAGIVKLGTSSPTDACLNIDASVYSGIILDSTYGTSIFKVVQSINSNVVLGLYSANSLQFRANNENKWEVTSVAAGTSTFTSLQNITRIIGGSTSFTLVNDVTIDGKLTSKVSKGINYPSGSDPVASLANGDLWFNTPQLKARIAGATRNIAMI